MHFTNQIEAVAYCQTPYKQKFGIPRQPGLVRSAKGKITLLPPYNQPDTIRGLERYSHLWLLFCFHETLKQGWKPMVRPPRLGGNDKLGVFATRSTFRPNGIGQSVVQLHKIEQKAGQVSLDISGMDLLDGTPIIDIKPYIPFSDAIDGAIGGIAQQAPQLVKVIFSAKAKAQLNEYKEYPNLPSLIEEVLAQDPRPGYKKGKIDLKQYQIALYDLDVIWQVKEETIVVSHIIPSNISKSSK
ncbi:tRNA (N6-threonylcarbamoyladenosine(37)-N6)-methyltransferase TrmO [uncultured Shewanella sp.]|uniref:tRNA (N6-threonylcarbamoyladenosine(37)-N6)-methyltransferase TrmO n=1 Tax=uncultured Shewanella sp. TaxID=173975 RepID=UPI00262565FD|nr:tRNA (N6-threonylcarbamoyladenosine(37)-N6)-methyltransferase TrmO [uncultured Shewanella sp.]